MTPKDETPPQLKKPDMYEALRDEGASKEKAARISNAAAQKGNSEKKVAAKGGKSGSYDDWTVDDLRGRAKELGVTGYSDLKKADLIEALRQH
ncbi:MULTISPECIES: DUF7218 family protein [unclassified Frigoribacterium]|jgi:hypothetical protein|uniref:DUF7218 family protein n=1 Tax=unclassified Frigoribacterium TaxID=2627005 RepID=UPI0005BB3ADA|nr:MULTISPECIES: Rho termination factor N-terminal domain-containing protein [unclassified Frigoribacterium]KIU03555.1 Rho termination factor [Frigoribacterium sp. MEB024]MBD8539940.1 Rho termination factor N-terminal domain-containing protein [Frigoribacterium sp. CFBP 8751]